MPDGRERAFSADGGASWRPRVERAPVAGLRPRATPGRARGTASRPSGTRSGTWPARPGTRAAARTGRRSPGGRRPGPRSSSGGRRAWPTPAPGLARSRECRATALSTQRFAAIATIAAPSAGAWSRRSPAQRVHPIRSPRGRPPCRAEPQQSAPEAGLLDGCRRARWRFLRADQNTATTRYMKPMDRIRWLAGGSAARRPRPAPRRASPRGDRRPPRRTRGEGGA